MYFNYNLRNKEIYLSLREKVSCWPWLNHPVLVLCLPATAFCFPTCSAEPGRLLIDIFIFLSLTLVSKIFSTWLFFSKSIFYWLLLCLGLNQILYFIQIFVLLSWNASVNISIFTIAFWMFGSKSLSLKSVTMRIIVFIVSFLFLSKPLFFFFHWIVCYFNHSTKL